MREGNIKCKCGHPFWIASVENSTACPHCGYINSIEHIPHKPKEEPAVGKSEKELAIEAITKAAQEAIAKIVGE